MTGSPQVDLNDVAVPLVWREVFGRDAPVHVDIGSGKSRFLLELALNAPGLNLLGVERAPKYARIGRERAIRRGAGNVRIVHTSAEDFLFRLARECSVACVYVLFPDPWPKKRHHKRRMLQPPNVTRMAEILEPGGLLMVKTDHSTYAEEIDAILAAAGGFRAELANELFRDLPLTGFEVKYRDEGRPVSAWALRKI